FKESVEAILALDIDLPPALAERAQLPLLSQAMPADFAALKQWLQQHLL
ncbi:MAG: threonine synthase, partial [Plesiomonas shigelloides]